MPHDATGAHVFTILPRVTSSFEAGLTSWPAERSSNLFHVSFVTIPTTRAKWTQLRNDLVTNNHDVVKAVTMTTASTIAMMPHGNGVPESSSTKFWNPVLVCT